MPLESSSGNKGEKNYKKIIKFGVTLNSYSASLHPTLIVFLLQHTMERFIPYVLPASIPDSMVYCTGGQWVNPSHHVLF